MKLQRNVCMFDYNEVCSMSFLSFIPEKSSNCKWNAPSLQVYLQYSWSYLYIKFLKKYRLEFKNEF